MVEAGEKLKQLLTESPEILEYLRLIKGVDVLFPAKSDVLIRTSEAAKFLGVSKNTIRHYVREKILTPMYTPNSNHMKFWLSDVKKIVLKR